MQKEQDIFIVQGKNKYNKLNDKDDMSNRVFIYDKNGEGKFLNKSGNKSKSNTIDLVTKISDKLAYSHRNYFIDKFGYDYGHDPEFIFDEEIRKSKKHKETNLSKQEDTKKKSRDKHIIVEGYLENIAKNKENLISKVTDDINKINEFRQQHKKIERDSLGNHLFEGINYDESSKKNLDKSKYLYRNLLKK